ncbi:MAG: MerR family transcriptional regulator [Massilia sp.]|nr:MAG: MerR family transcriptional regulator [Massilia sp.]
MSTRDNPPAVGDLIPITEVERQTGIRQATLRMWEKRYGFPQPLRDRHGDRVYPPFQVERLHAVRRLMDQGLRPGKIFAGALASGAPGLAAVSPSPACLPEHFRHVFVLLREYRLSELHGLFQHRLLDLGLRRFIIDFLAPLATEVGLAWNRGELPVRSEHLFAQVASSALHAKQAAVRTTGDGRPKVVLATLTGEAHALGILMAEGVMSSLGMNCIQLGAETPAVEVAAAARETCADIVALSFSSYFPRKSLVRLVAAMRSSLPSTCALWVGGDGVRGAPALEAGIDTFRSLEAIETGLRRWQGSHAAEKSVREHHS